MRLSVQFEQIVRCPPLGAAQSQSATADDWEDCVQEADRDLLIRACSAARTIIAFIAFAASLPIRRYW